MIIPLLKKKTQKIQKKKMSKKLFPFSQFKNKVTDAYAKLITSSN